MTVMAFLYETYYCHGPKSCFAGVYDDKDDALKHIKGDRFGKKNLELVDTETYEFNRFVWVSPYRIVKKDNKEYLQYKWGKDNPLIELIHDGEVREYNENNPLYYGGEWQIESHAPDDRD